MKKKFICICLVLSVVVSMITGCSSGSSSSNSWEKDAKSIGYEKKSDGKWYYTGKGVY